MIKGHRLQPEYHFVSKSTYFYNIIDKLFVVVQNYKMCEKALPIPVTVS